MKLFVDSADLADIETIASWGVLSGVTTNPTLLGKVEGEADDIYRRVCELVNGPVSAEVVAESRGDMVEDGRRLAAIHPNIVVKLPMGAEALAATTTLAEDDIRVNMTLCFTAPQALLAAAAGAGFVSPFVGRFDDIGQDGLEVLREVVEALEPSMYDTEVLAASIRSPVHVTEAARMGADIATIPPKVFYQMLQHPSRRRGSRRSPRTSRPAAPAGPRRSRGMIGQGTGRGRARTHAIVIRLGATPAWREEEEVSDSDSDFPFPFAFGEGAGEEFKERLKELMRAQREAFEEVQAESGGQLAAVDRWQVIQQAVVLASAAMRAMEPRPTPDEAADAMGLLFARSMAALQGALRPTP